MIDATCGRNISQFVSNDDGFKHEKFLMVQKILSIYGLQEFDDEFQALSSRCTVSLRRVLLHPLAACASASELSREEDILLDMFTELIS